MCGKPNPEQAETCKYCQARLKPLIKPSMPGSSEPTRRRPPLTGRNASDLDSSIPDWLSDLRSPQDNVEGESGSIENQPGSMPEEITDSEAESGVPDWLSRIQSDGAQTPPTPSPDQQGLPDWLANLGNAGKSSDQSEPLDEESSHIEPAEQPVENEPDWLKRIRARQKGEDTQEEILPGNDEGLPGSIAPASPLPAVQLPEWLSNLGKQETSSSDGSSAAPDWSLLGDAQEPAAEQESIPDWFAQLDDKNQAGSPDGDQVLPPEREIPEEPVSPAPVSVDDTTRQGPVAAFTEDIDTAGFEEDAGTTPFTSSTLPHPDEGLPDWLRRLEASSPEKPQQENVPAFIEDEVEQPVLPKAEEPEPILETPDLNTLPDWISQLPTEEASAEETASEAAASPANKSGEADVLMPAELPSWLEAMRPVEAVTPPSAVDAMAKMEKAGPLAGLRGALSAEPGAVAVQKPKVFSVKLQITENQQAHMALMEELLKTEGIAKPVVSRPIVNAQFVMRILVALILLLAVVAPLWINNNLAPMPEPALAPQEVLDASRLVTGIAPGGLVLLAFDYEPGLSGEMDVSATSLVEQLMSRNAYLTIVSTNVSGPLLAERLLGGIAAKKGTSYASAVNLGYVPGGASALLSLAGNPRQVLPYDLRSVKVWDNGPLANVKTMADFALVIVFTEKADTARGWVEQVQPTLRKNNTPLLMVVSAQAEPMVKPYYETNPKQIAGMISGLAGFAAYDSITGQTGLARRYWDAYGGGMLAAAGLLILGGFLYGGMAVFAPRKRAKGEGAE
jgi:hypothetical protein